MIIIWLLLINIRFKPETIPKVSIVCKQVLQQDKVFPNSPGEEISCKTTAKGVFFWERKTTEGWEPLIDGYNTYPADGMTVFTKERVDIVRIRFIDMIGNLTSTEIQISHTLEDFKEWLIENGCYTI